MKFLNRRRSINKDLLFKEFKKKKKRLPKSFTHDLGIDFKYLIMYPVCETASTCWLHIIISCNNCSYIEERIINNSFKFHRISDLEKNFIKEIIHSCTQDLDSVWYNCKSHDKNIDIFNIMVL